LIFIKVMNSSVRLSGRGITWGARTYVMGILNITPDSFSGDGLLTQTEKSEEQDSDWHNKSTFLDKALEQAQRFIAKGADILDVGGESTRPGAQMINASEELARVIPPIHALATSSNVLLSIDTYKAEVAEEAIKAGAHIVNDVSGLHADSKLAEVVAQYDVPVILMHNRSSWAQAEIKERLGGRYVGVPYENLLEDVKRDLLESVAIAHQAGVQDQQIILDPGIGFGKTVEQNLELIDRLGEFRTMGYPILLGPSRKSFIGFTLDLPPDQRLAGTAAAVALGIARGADIVRVHDVEFMVRVARMTDAIVRRHQ
jgi:dihydropteroate synthase